MKSGFTHESTYNESKEWYTPPSIFKQLGVVFDLDPCAPVVRSPKTYFVPARKWLTIIENGLTTEWNKKDFVFMNPPYGSDTPKWMKKLAEHKNGIALVFARTDTNWFHDYAAKADIICFIRGRLRFYKPDGTVGGTPGSGSMLLGYGIKAISAIKKVDGVTFEIQGTKRR